MRVGLSPAVDDLATAWTDGLGDIALPEGALQRMAAHWALVCQWNARTNLTAITGLRRAIALHYRDSLAVLPYLKEGPLVDFGSGAGYPGLVLAMARPTWQVTLVEPRRKRVSFLQTAVARLQMTNVKVVCGRLEDAACGTFKHAVTRATFSREVHQATLPWLAAGGSLLMYRAADADNAPEAQTKPYALRFLDDDGNMSEVQRMIAIWQTVP